MKDIIKNDINLLNLNIEHSAVNSMKICCLNRYIIEIPGNNRIKIHLKGDRYEYGYRLKRSHAACRRAAFGHEPRGLAERGGGIPFQ